MIFDVMGVDGQGKQHTLRIRASSEDEALKHAKKKGIFATKVTRNRDAEQRDLRLQETENLKQALNNRIKTVVDSTIQIMRETIESGRRVFIYQKLFMSVDSSIDGHAISGEPDIRELQRLGLESWEVVQVIPRTSGVSLSNNQYTATMIPIKVGESHAGGIGGNIDGVYLLMRKEVLLADIEGKPSTEIEEYVAMNFAGDLLMELGVVSSDEYGS